MGNEMEYQTLYKEPEKAAVTEATPVEETNPHEDMILDAIELSDDGAIAEGHWVRIHRVTDTCYRVNIWEELKDRRTAISTNRIARSYFMAIREDKAVILH